MNKVLVVLGLAALVIGGAVVNWEHSQIVDCPSGHCGLEWEMLQQLVAEADEPIASQQGDVQADVPSDPAERPTAEPTPEPPDDDDWCPVCPPGLPGCEPVCPPVFVTGLPPQKTPMP